MFSGRQPRSQKITLDKTKFVYPDSCYSFIAYIDRSTEQIEIYFPPDVAIADDFFQWLTKHNFKLVSTSNTVYVSELDVETEKATENLLKSAQKNGAYSTDSLKDLPDRSSGSTVANNSIKSKFEQLIEKHLEKALLKIEQKNQQLVAKYEREIARLKNELEGREKQVSKLESENKELAGKLREYEELMDLNPSSTEAIAYQSPFDSPNPNIPPQAETEDTTHLNSPFCGGEFEVLSADEYDETELNKLEAPADLTPGSSGEKALDELDISELEDVETDLDSAMEKLEQQNGKKSSN